MAASKTATPTIVLRPMREEDIEGVFELYDIVFGVNGGKIFRERWRWAHVVHPIPEHSPKWVLADGDAIVGFLASMALPYLVNGKRVIANTTCDYMVHPDHRFHGIKLMKEFFSVSDNVITCDDMKATLKVCQWLGAKPIGNMVRYTKVLDARFLKMRNGRFSRVPSPLLLVATLGLRLKDAVKSIGAGSSFPITPVLEFDDRFDKFSEKLSQQVPAMIVRDSAFLRWRYGEQSPHEKVNVGAVFDDSGELNGYVIYYVSTTAGNEKLGHIVDLQVTPIHDTKTANALMRYAVKNLRKQGAWVVYFRRLPSSMSALMDNELTDYGFLPRGRHVFMVKMNDSDLAAVTENEQNWNYSFGDSEASHSLV